MQQQDVRFKMAPASLLLLVLFANLGSLSAALAPDMCVSKNITPSNLSAVCSLELVGKGPDTVGIERVRLSCTSTTGDKVPVGIASTAPNAPLAGLSAIVRQQLEQHGSGITVVKPACQQQTEVPAVADNLVPLFGLLYLCEGTITTQNLVVRDLFLPYTLRSRGQDDTAPLVIGGTAHVTVVGAKVQRVVASTAIALVQDAELSVTDSAFDRNEGNPGSGVFARDRTALRIASSNFTNSHSSDQGGALAIMGCCNATVQDSLFLNCSADQAGGAVYVVERASLLASNTWVMNSTAGNGKALQSQGGGIFCQGRYLGLFNGTRIMYNNAHGNGGGLYTSVRDDPVKGAVQLYVSPDTIISWNEAVGGDLSGPSAGGGAFVGYATTFDPAVVKAVARNNKAPRDADVGTEPDTLTVLSATKVLGYVARPDDLDWGLRVELKLIGEKGFPCGGRNIQAFWDSASDRKAGGDNGGSGSGSAKHTNATTASGVAVMLLRFFEPPGQHNITFMVEALPYLTAEVTVEVRQCWKGEQEERPGVCRVCPAGSYNFQPGRCEECPAHAECAGGSAVLSQPGFWLSSPQHNVVHRCPNPQACTANRSSLQLQCSDVWSSNSTNSSLPTLPSIDPCYLASGFANQNNGSFQTAQCSVGYLGHVCGKCQEGYGSVKPFRCKQCYNKGALVFMYIMASLLLLAFMKLVCWLTLRKSSQAASTPSAASATTASSTPPEPADILRQLVLFIQYTLILTSVQASESWPETIAKPVEALAWLWAPASPHTLAPGCLARSGSSATGVAVVVFYVVLPLVLLALLLLLEVLVQFVRDRVGPYSPARARAARWRGSHSSFKDQLIAASMVVIFFFLPSIVRSCFGLFACINIDKPAQPPNMPLAVGSFWIHDTDQLCFVGWHRRLAIGLGIPLLLFVCFVPGFILYKTLPNRAMLDDPLWLQHYGFLVQGFKPRCRFWEAVVSAQTILLVAISVFSYTLGPFYQAVLMNVAIAVIWLVLAVVRPLAHKETQRVAFVSMGCLFLTSYSALAFVQMSGDSNGTDLSLTDAEGAAIPSFMGVVVMFVNCAFLAWVLWKLMRMVKWREHWQRVCCARSAVLTLVSSASSRGASNRDLPTRAQSMRGQAEGEGLHGVHGAHSTSQDDVTVELSSAGMRGKVLGGRDQRPGIPV